jgi:hypothetical protein
MNVCSLSALRCRFALGCCIDPSFERGRCRRLLLRTEPDGPWLAEGENIVLVSLEEKREQYHQRTEGCRSSVDIIRGVRGGSRLNGYSQRSST